ncbi:MAG: VOC family protein [Acidimicrobiia bacterium]
MGTELSHLFMLVRDLKQAKWFWVELLGLEVLVEYPGYVRVGGGSGFHIGMEEGDPGPPNNLEIAVVVEDVDETYQRLTASGVELEGLPEDQDWGARHVWLRDPDGRRMSIYS